MVKQSSNPYFVGRSTNFEDYFREYSGLGRVKVQLKVWREQAKVDSRLKKTLAKKECYYGPFKGEFGHILGHNIPFLGFLKSRGVKVHYCGMELFKPFMLDEHGESLVESFHPLRDFFGEVKPRSNNASPPEDVRMEIQKFKAKAENSGLPFWNIDDDFYYWYIHRNWLAKKNYSVIPALDKVYRTKEDKSVVIFARKKGKDFTPNNGGPWDYMELARSIAPFFDKVFITGHPLMSDSLVTSEDNIEVHLTSDNRKILELCSNSKLIVSQHSGVCYLGEYTDSQVLVIFKGPPPIKGIPDTFRFKEYVGEKYPLKFAFSEEEVVSFVEDFVKRRK